MDYLEQENRVLQDEVAAMQAKMDEMAEKMKTMEAAQIQTSPPVRTRAEASSSVVPEWTKGADTPTHSAPQRSMPWFPPLTAGEVLRPVACEAQMSAPQYIAQVPLFSAGETFRPVAYESQVPTRQYTAQAPPLSAGETLRPVAYETRIPARQHADFEKYKGNSCPEEHLTMYVRRMSAYARDDQVLIYYFQESLASPASKWYMNLDKTRI